MRTGGSTISFRCSTSRCCRLPVGATARALKRSRAPGDTRRVETDWRRLIEAKDIDLIDICVPNVAHKEIAVAAAEAGKMVVCEKPLAMNVAEAEAMVRAVKTAGVANMIFFNYRRVPAISLAKQLIEEGRIGRAVPLSRHVSAGLDDFGGRAAGRSGPMAAGRRRMPAVA